MSCAEQDLVIQQGKTFSRVVRWESFPLVYKAITAITRGGPVSITATSHGMPDNWRATVVSAGGMRQINASTWPPRANDFHRAIKVDANTVTFNDVDSELYTVYTSGGSLVYYTPVSLAGYTARMTIKDVVGGTAQTSGTLTTSNSRIALDDTAKTITLTISATDTALIDWASGVYDLELVSGTGVVTQLLKGNVTVEDEVTT